MHLLDDFYPAGDEQVTVFEVTGRIVPQGGIPLRVGCVVVNVETLLNVADAMEGKPLTHKYLTITGEVASPCTVRLPVGTPVMEALKLAGVKNTDDLRVIDGGPMMGKLIGNLHQPITKTTKGLIALRGRPSGHPQTDPELRKNHPSGKKRLHTVPILHGSLSKVFAGSQSRTPSNHAGNPEYRGSTGSVKNGIHLH